MESQYEIDKLLDRIDALFKENSQLKVLGDDLRKSALKVDPVYDGYDWLMAQKHIDSWDKFVNDPH